MIEIYAGQPNKRVKDTGEPKNEAWIRTGQPFGAIAFNLENPERTTGAAELSNLSWQLPGLLSSMVDQLREIGAQSQLPPPRLELVEQAGNHLKTYLTTMAQSFFAE